MTPFWSRHVHILPYSPGGGECEWEAGTRGLRRARQPATPAYARALASVGRRYRRPGLRRLFRLSATTARPLLVPNVARASAMLTQAVWQHEFPVPIVRGVPLASIGLVGRWTHWPR